jgi:hypothetical protein
VLGQLLKLDLRHGHEGVYFMLRAFEVFDAECINGNDLDAGLVAHLEYLMTGQ